MADVSKENPKEKKKAGEIVLKGIRNKEIDAVVYTTNISFKNDKKKKEDNDKEHEELANAYKIFMADTKLVIDCHMHIMSVNCTPLTLIWSLLYQKTLGVEPVKFLFVTAANVNELHLKGNDRVATYEPTTSEKSDLKKYAFKDMGPITRLSTDLIAKLFMGKLRNSEMKESLYWTIGVGRNTSSEVAGKQAALEDLTDERSMAYADKFYKDTAKYFDNCKVLHMFYVMSYDMSYSHFWGKYGLPVYLPITVSPDKTTEKINGYYYINDFICATRTSGKQSINVIELDRNSYIPETTQAKTHLFPNTDLLAELDRFLDFYRFKAGITDKKPEPFFLCVEDAKLAAVKKLISEKLSASTSKPKTADQDNTDQYKKNIEQELAKIRDAFKADLGKPNKHFLVSAPGENTERFEDYWIQKKHTESSAVKFPLQLIPFYHYDPRRHYADKDGSGQKKLGKLASDHAFFEYVEKFQSFSHKDFTVRGAFIELRKMKTIDSTYLGNFFKDFKAEEADDESLLTGYKLPNSAVIDNTIAKTGLFWGIKMYPAMGYRPDDFDTYPHLKLFYADCVANDLPILFHGSPRGMIIGDSHNFMHEVNPQTRYTINQTIDFVDDSCAHPRHWRNVLDGNANLKKLKICFAHFGGYDLWSGNPSKLPDWRNDIRDIIASHDNVYTDLACFINKDAGKMGKALADFIQGANGSKLRKRILMGSDWYLFEANQEVTYEGIPLYYLQMFKVLRELTKKVSPQWDAWHQFAVINPLRFMGFIDPDTEPEDAKLKMDKVEKFAKNVKEKFKDNFWTGRHALSTDDCDRIIDKIKPKAECEEDQLTDNLAVQLSDMLIVNAEKLKKDNKLRILL